MTKTSFWTKQRGRTAFLRILAAAALSVIAALDLSGAQIAKPDPAKRDMIRVATYNVRGPNDRAPNSWKDRLPRMVQTIRENQFELIGSQETLAGPIRDLCNELQFQSFGVGRDKQKKDGMKKAD